jgi:hypothetical protein
MVQTITINSITYSGESATILFKPDNSDAVINIGVVTLPYIYNSSPREIYGSYTILVQGSNCSKVMFVPRPTPEPPTPPPPPVLNGIYFGKFSGETITSGDTVNLTFKQTNKVVSTFITYPTGSGYGYILIPQSFIQPNGFRDSTNGCFGNNIPINNIGTVNVPDINGNVVIYNIYRTFFSFSGLINCWMCG